MDLSQLHPELLSSWDSEKNSNFNIHNVRAKDKVWWICEKWHEYEATVDSRKRGTWCPYCCNKKILKWYNDLATTNSELIKERHFEKNKKMWYSPYEISKWSSIKVWRKCEKWHERQAIVYSRTVENANWCPYCSNQKVLRWYNDLGTTNPIIAKQWNYEKNWNITPETVNEGSNNKYRWKCEKWHERKASIKSRSQWNGNCPFCLNQKVQKWYNDLASTYPELLKEWDYERNWNISPDTVNVGSNNKYWWKCEKWHHWETKVLYRTRKKFWCPYCGNQKVLKWYNDLETKNPELLKERDFKKNKIKPSELQAWSELKVWWICPQWHSYKAGVDLRTKRNQGCPICSKWLHISFPEKSILYYISKFDKNIIENFKDINKWISELDIYIPSKNIAIEYDWARRHSKERDILKNEICLKNKIKLFRIREIWCSELDWTSIDFYVTAEKYNELNDAIKMLIKKIYNQYVDVDIERDKLDILKLMDLNYKKSAKDLPIEILRQRDYKRNKWLVPSAFALLSHRKIWRTCKEWHHFKASVANRKNWRGCPYCSNHKLLSWFNDLATKFPYLVNEWNYEKNKDLKPNEIMSKSWKKVWRKCKEWHEREAKVCNRSNWKWCPYCAGKIKE